jgi:CcmD family protein
MHNGYLIVAYGLVWAILAFYAGTIHYRRQRLERELEELKRELGLR